MLEIRKGTASKNYENTFFREFAENYTFAIGISLVFNIKIVKSKSFQRSQ